MVVLLYLTREEVYKLSGGNVRVKISSRAFMSNSLNGNYAAGEWTELWFRAPHTGPSGQRKEGRVKPIGANAESNLICSVCDGSTGQA